MGRQSNNKMWIFGKHAVIAALSNPKRQVFGVMVTRSAYDNLMHQGLISDGLKVEIAEPHRIESIVGRMQIHQGYAAHVGGILSVSINDLLQKIGEKKRSTIVALDQVTDPQNVGAILRSAAAFDVDGVVMTNDNSAINSASLIKSACGAVEVVPILPVANLVNALEMLKDAGYWVVGLDAGATEHISKLGGFDKVVIVMGSEGEGLRRLSKRTCDVMLSIPISQNMESLNVSVATAIAIFSHTAAGVQ